MALRLRGQEVTLVVVRGGILEATLTDVVSFELEMQSEIRTQGYLGEKTNRKDDIYNGVRGMMEIHTHTDDWISFMNAVLDRQRRILPDLVVNVAGLLAYANGQNPSFNIPDAKFGAWPLTTPGRHDYVKLRLQFEADDFSVTGL